MTNARKPLRRSNDQVIAGVCAGIAEYFGWPANRVRWAYALVSIFSVAFPGILVYLALWLLMPAPADDVGTHYTVR